MPGQADTSGPARMTPASEAGLLTAEASLAARRFRLAEAAARGGLDALVVPGWGLLKRHGHLDWLVGAAPPARPAWAVLLPGGELTVLALGEGDARHLSAAGSGADVVVTGPDEVGLARGSARLVDAVRLGRGTLGVVGRDSLLSAGALRELQRLLPGARIEEARPLADAAKARKDAYELARLGAAADCASAAYERACAAARPRATCAEVAAEAYAEAIRRGARDALVFAGSGLYHGFPPSTEPLQPGSLLTLYVELCDRAGYWVEQIGMVAIGELDERRQRLASAVLAALAAGEAKLEPGVAQGAAAEAMRGSAAELGYGTGLNHSFGHGVGTGDDDLPRVAPGERAPLEPGMALVLHPNLSDRLMSAAAGGVYAITDEGAERLGSLGKELRTAPG